METSLFISRVVGPLFVIVGLGLLLNSRDYQVMIQDISKNLLVIYISGMLACAMGLLILMSQNTFVILTILGYVALLKGIAILLFPEWSIRTTQRMNLSEYVLQIAGVSCLVLGGYVSYLGFM